MVTVVTHGIVPCVMLPWLGVWARKPVLRWLTCARLRLWQGPVGICRTHARSQSEGGRWPRAHLPLCTVDRCCWPKAVPACVCIPCGCLGIVLNNWNYRNSAGATGWHNGRSTGICHGVKHILKLAILCHIELAMPDMQTAAFTCALAHTTTKIHTCM